MFRLRAKARFTQLADAETRGRMGDTEIDLADASARKRTTPPHRHRNSETASGGGLLLQHGRVR